MLTRLQEVDHLLDDLDQQIMERYPEIEHDWLHYTIADKVQLEIERSRLIEKDAKLCH